jgi:hypothetical protein
LTPRFSLSAALVISIAALGCASSVPRGSPRSASEPRKVVVYDGAMVEGQLEQALEPSSPRPLETEDEKRAQVRALSLQHSPCDLQIESVPHGIAITFFAREAVR